MDLQERLLGDDKPTGFEQVGMHESIGDAGFVFQADEHVAFSCAWALAANDKATNAYGLAIAQVSQVGGSGKFRKTAACVIHRMAPGG